MSVRKLSVDPADTVWARGGGTPGRRRQASGPGGQPADQRVAALRRAVARAAAWTTSTGGWQDVPSATAPNRRRRAGRCSGEVGHQRTAVVLASAIPGNSGWY